jgi:predicted RNase H-like HicB family nuclease
MSKGDRYIKLVEWSEEDACFIGSCPELFYGGCHGSDAKTVFSELCEIVDETVEIYGQEGRSLPSPLSGRDIVNALQSEVSR